MSTRTAIFKEQADGTFQGIYCQNDGYIEGVGAMLHEYYQNPDKVQRLIDNGMALSSIGISEQAQVIDYSQHPDLYTEDRVIKFCFSVNEYKEQFLANKLEQIRTFNYLTLEENGEVAGYHQTIAGKNVFVPFRGSDNNGYLYVQKLSGKWLVSTMKSDGDMTKFKTLNQYFSKKAG